MHRGALKSLRRWQTVVVVMAMAVTLVTEAMEPPYTHFLLDQYGTGTVVSRSEFVQLVEDLMGASTSLDAFVNSRPPSKALESEKDNGTSPASTDECFDVDKIFEEFAGSSAGKLNASGLERALAAAVFTLTSPRCGQQSNASLDSSTSRHLNKPSKAEAWGYGVGIITLICLISNIGGFLGPIMKKAYFQKILIFLVALAVGALVGTGIMVLIPEAFSVMNVPELEHDYLWKAATVVVGLYIFYWSERLMKIGIQARKNKNKKRKQSKLDMELNVDLMAPGEAQKALEASKANGGHGHSHEHTGPIKTVAWMVMVGDGLHKFMDGLSIGAALTENIYTALSIAIAILCEELPHELGDIAILLHSGMSMKRALLINLLTAAIGFVGLVIGILLGESTEANRWIFAAAAGIFLYVSMVDMLPEMSETAEQYAYSWRMLAPVLVLQTLGLIIGFAIILVVAHFSKQIAVG